MQTTVYMLNNQKYRHILTKGTCTF